MDKNMGRSDSLEIDLRHALLMISRALDYVGVDDIFHGHRVAYIAYECAKKLEWPREKCQLAYYTGLIHDSGVSTTDEHSLLVGYLQPEDVQAHCVRGYLELLKCPLLERFAIPVLYHHTQWQELKDLDLTPLDRDIAAIIYLSDRLDFLRTYYVKGHHQEAITLHKEMVCEHIQEHSGTQGKIMNISCTTQG